MVIPKKLCIPRIHTIITHTIIAVGFFNILFSEIKIKGSNINRNIEPISTEVFLREYIFTPLRVLILLFKFEIRDIVENKNKENIVHST